MKKLFIQLFLITFIMTSIQAKIIMKSGENNKTLLKGAKPVYVYLTFNGTIIYDVSINQYIKELKEEKMDVYKLTKEFLINDFKGKTKKYSERRGKKWEMKVIENLGSVKKGFLITLNFDKLIPIPTQGFRSEGTVNIFKASNLKSPIISYKIESFVFDMTWIPRYSFGNSGPELMEEVIMFLNRI